MPLYLGSMQVVPAPLIDVRKSYLRDQNQRVLRPQYFYTLHGTIDNFTGTQTATSGVHYLEGVLQYKHDLELLLNSASQSGLLLRVTSPTNNSGLYDIKSYCIVDDIAFDQGVWVDKCNYTITLRSDNTLIDGAVETPYSEIRSTNENWNISESEDGTFSISHQLEATGELIYSASGYNNPLGTAQSWCRDRRYSITTGGVKSGGDGIVSFNNVLSNISTNTANFWNYAVVEGIGGTAYSWQITESFLHAPSGSTREEFTISANYDSDNIRKASFSVNGSIYGYADRSSNLSLRNQNAKTRFDLIEPTIYSRLANGYSAASGYTINPIPSSKQITYDNPVGAVRYSYVYSAMSGALISNAIDENINVSDIGPTDVFAQIPVPGRTNGPVVQYMQTKTLSERTVSITATMAQSGVTLASLRGAYLSKPDVSAIINALTPSAGWYYIKQNSEDWNPLRKQYSRVISWVLQAEGSGINGVPSGIHNVP
jgi:hypothetical protein